MDKKYFDTKKGSVEEKINTIASEQPTINATYTPDVKLSTEKKYFETKKGSIEELAGKLIESKLDPVNKDAVKKKFDDRKDKDIDNDGDTDSTDKYLHKRRAAISKAMKEDLGKEDEPKVQKIIGKLKKASDAHAGQAKDLEKAMKEKAISTKGATRKPTSASDRLYLSNPNEHRRRQELEFMYKRILASMPEKERNSKEGKIQAMDMARVRSAKNKKDLTKNMKNKGTLKIADSVTQDDHGEKINQDKKDAAMKKTDQKKDFKSLRAETRIIKLGDKGKTATGKDAGAVDVEPSAKPI
jgi:hypothetical protein